MDPEYLRKMAEIEEDPHFRSKKYVIVDQEDRMVNPGETPVVLEHPNEVVVVASPTGKAPPPASGEFRVKTLSKAVQAALCKSRMGRSGCTIVVHEGLYVDPFVEFGMKDMAQWEGWSKHFHLEIVGMENVRVLNTDKVVFSTFVTRGKRLTVKNVSIYDWSNAEAATIYCRASTALNLVDVRMHGKDHASYPFLCSDVADVSMRDCCFSGTKCSFGLTGSKAHLQRCRWTGIHGDAFLIGKDSEVKIEDSFFGEVKQLSVTSRGKLDLLRCEFVRSKFLSDQRYSGIQVSSGGQISMEECSMELYKEAILVRDSESNAVLKHCRFDAYYIALRALLNGNAVFENCSFSGGYVACLQLNTRGNLRFRDNCLRQSSPSSIHDQTDHLECASFLSDRESKSDRIVHDFEQCRFDYDDLPTPITQSVGASRRSQKDSYRIPSTDVILRLCLRCKKTNDPHYEGRQAIKFMYCSRCRKVCYCSKECQNAHWRDHKLLCRRS